MIKMEEEITKIAKELSEYNFRNTNRLLIPSQVMLKALKDLLKKSIEKTKKDINKVKESLKYPSSATEGKRILMKQIVDIFESKINSEISK